jgi:FlaA1/EpsC-like NDP-sugar epimerase/predicted RNA-binding Zn-ribbon protein involved in translation (DUF1610 family)
MTPELKSTVLRLRRLLSVTGQLALVALANGCAFLLRFDGQPPAWAFATFWHALPWLVFIRAVTFVPFRLYEGLWRYTSIWDLKNLLFGIATSSIVFALFNASVLRMTYPRSIHIIDAVLLILVLGGIRLTRRLVTELGRKKPGRRVLVYGAGDTGEAIVRDMQRKIGHDYVPIGFLDDDRSKVGQRIHGVRVLGTRVDLSHIIRRQRPDEILLAIPHADPAVYRSITRALERYNIPIKTLPTLRELLEDKVDIHQIRKLSVHDLLSRIPVGLDPAPLRHFLQGRRVLVTGAGGSIGAELCRQISGLGAQTLVLFERHENSLYDIVNDLADRGSRTRVHAVIGDVTDAARVDAVLTEYRPDIVFHAAAHKHVPLMDDNACEAVKNNVTGTRLLTEAAESHGVDRFILISTDKAVNPTSVMGATKRVAELMLLTQGVGSATSFITVRFGNVLASAGSVVPRFLKQIEAGGPVTVTHPEMRRYFMLIPEAVQLVLHAAAQGQGGKLYVLDMGEQIKIVDMARALIRLAGFVPEVEIPITFIGLRPGEKLYEELTGPDETSEPSGTTKVMYVKPLAMPDPETLARDRAQVEDAAHRNDTGSVLKHLGHIVPAFETARVNSLAATSGAQVEALRAVAESTAVSRPAALEYLCPDCSSRDVRRSHARPRIRDRWKSLSQKRPYRCHACGWRGWLLREPSGAHRVTVDDGPPPNLVAIDELVRTDLSKRRSVFLPRDLRTP